MKAVIVVGLPASGKSYYISTVRDCFDRVYDDEFFRIEKEFSENILIASPDFCIEHIRNHVEKQLTKQGYEVAYIFYENNPEQCLKNAKFRKDKKVDELIRQLTKMYDPPRIDRKVYKGVKDD